MTGPFFSTGPCKRVALNANTSADITSWIAALQIALTSSNWTLVSTFSGHNGTLGINMRSFPTPNNQTAILKVFWDGSAQPFGAGNIITFQMSDGSAGNLSSIGQVTLIPSKTFTLVTHPQQFFLWSTNAGVFQLNVVCAGVPNTLGSGQTYWGSGDTGLFGNPNFVNNLAMTTGRGLWSYLLNGVLVTQASVPTGDIPLQLLTQRSHNFSVSDPVQFANGFSSIIEPIMMMLQEIGVFLWDAVVINKSFATNLTFQYFGRTFEVITLGFNLGALAVVIDDSAKGFSPGYAY